MCGQNFNFGEASFLTVVYVGVFPVLETLFLYAGAVAEALFQ